MARFKFKGISSRPGMTMGNMIAIRLRAKNGKVVELKPVPPAKAFNPGRELGWKLKDKRAIRHLKFDPRFEIVPGSEQEDDPTTTAAPGGPAQAASRGLPQNLKPLPKSMQPKDWDDVPDDFAVPYIPDDATGEVLPADPNVDNSGTTTTAPETTTQAPDLTTTQPPDQPAMSSNPVPPRRPGGRRPAKKDGPEDIYQPNQSPKRS